MKKLSKIKTIADLSYPLSDLDIKRFFNNHRASPSLASRPGIKILRYSDLNNYSDLFDAIGPDERLIILFENEKINHWVLVMVIRKPGYNPFILFHDSYGVIPVNEFEYIPRSFQKMTNQDRDILLKLLIDCPLETRYSPYRLQKISSSISTCGKHACVRGLFNEIDEDQYAKLIKSGKKYGLSPDQVVNEIFLDYLNDIFKQ